MKIDFSRWTDAVRISIIWVYESILITYLLIISGEKKQKKSRNVFYTQVRGWRNVVRGDRERFTEHRTRYESSRCRRKTDLKMCWTTARQVKIRDLFIPSQNARMSKAPTSSEATVVIRVLEFNNYWLDAIL